MGALASLRQPAVALFRSQALTGSSCISAELRQLGRIGLMGSAIGKVGVGVGGVLVKLVNGAAGWLPGNGQGSTGLYHVLMTNLKTTTPPSL